MIAMEKREQFETEGYFLFRDILEPELIARLGNVSDSILGEQDKQHFEQQRTTGSMVLIDWEMACQHTVFAKLVAHPRALAALDQLGFTEPKFGHGRIISKPPHSPPLFWHEDGRFWNDPVSYTPQPIQVFLMYYLTDTTPRNGCLRVIPGSHQKRHSLHDCVADRHTNELRTYLDPNNPQFQRAEGEIDIPVNAGDLVVGYATLFHASHPNSSDERRTALTMWYYPDFVNLPGRTQATVNHVESRLSRVTTSSSPSHLWDAMEPLKISYEGKAKRIEQEWVPGNDLR